MMTCNVVTLTYDLNTDEDTLVAWSEQLEQHDASVSVVPGHGVDIVVWVDGGDVFSAPAVAADIALKVVPDAPVGLSVVSEAEFARMAQALP